MKVFINGEGFVGDHEQNLVYNGMDTQLTFEVFNQLSKQLDGDTGRIYRFEKLMLGPVMTMMRRGIKIDMEARGARSDELSRKIRKVEALLYSLLNAVFDYEHEADGRFINSPARLNTLFFDWLSIPKKGFSSDRESLEKIQRDYARAKPFCSLILKARDYQKQLEVMNKTLSPTLRWAASYNIAGTETGRWSSSEHPMKHSSNAQNIDPDMRDIFIADPGYTLVYVDLKGAEAKGVGYISGDANYIKAVESEDVHTMVAAMVFGIPPVIDAAEKEYYNGFSYRDMAKRCAHGSNYMGKPQNMARILKLDPKVVEHFQYKYFKQFPGIRTWHQETVDQIQKESRIFTPLGRRRIFWERSWEESTWREAVAYVPQSVIADITNIGIYKIWYRLEGNPHLQLLANIHDGILMQVKTECLKEVIEEVLKLTEVVVPVRGRLLIIPNDVKIGMNWREFDKKKGINPNGLKKYEVPIH